MGAADVVAALKDFVVKELLEGRDSGLNEQTPLLAWGLINSITLVKLTQFIEARFQVSVPVTELTPANLKNLETIAALVEKRLRP